MTGVVFVAKCRQSVVGILHARLFKKVWLILEKNEKFFIFRATPEAGSTSEFLTFFGARFCL